MKGSQRVVLVGDHKQLPPVIKNRDAEAGGLGMSLFERLMHLGAPSAMLQVMLASARSAGLACYANTVG
jgi:superfamily I DNA and/or RNA helicase